MITISITNQKGGEGKTTTSINLAEGLARRGKKTILLDMDPQSNSTSIYTSTSLDQNMFHIFHNKAKLNQIIHQTSKPNLFVAPASSRLAEMEAVSANNVEAPFILRDAMEDLDGFDFCIIDCPPSLSIFTINALVASNFVLIPLQAEKFSVDGIVGLQQTITSIKKRINPQLEIIGALITQLKPHTLPGGPGPTTISPIFFQEPPSSINSNQVKICGSVIMGPPQPLRWNNCNLYG